MRYLGYVFYDSLKKAFSDNKTWSEALSTRDSVTSKILLSEYFHVVDTEGNKVEDGINIEALLCFGLLHAGNS